MLSVRQPSLHVLRTLTDPPRVRTTTLLATEHPYFTAGLLALGALTFAKFLLKFFGVVLQTFVLPGTNVSVEIMHIRHEDKRAAHADAFSSRGVVGDRT